MMDRSKTSLVETTLFGTEDIVEKAVKEIQATAKTGRLCLRFSGGKDSVVVKRLLDMAGVPYTARFSRTSVDPPELLDFIRREHQDVIVEEPRISMFQLIIKKGFPPTRVCRYCCQEFKERNVCGKGDGLLTVTGVRKAESPRRESRAKYETCQADRGVNFYHPIVNWSDEQVWDFIRAEFKRWPQFEKAYLWAFEKMLEGRSFDKWKTKFDVMDWYIYGAEEDCREVAALGLMETSTCRP